MSDLVGIVAAHGSNQYDRGDIGDRLQLQLFTGVILFKHETSRGKANNMVSEQVQHKPACTVIEAG